SKLDGTFTLPKLPRGMVEIEIKHDWYVTTKLQIHNTGREREIVLGRGATWTGRVIDPDGVAIERCDLTIEKADRSTAYATCSGAGFAFTALPRGDTTVKVRLQEHPLGKFRLLKQRVAIAANELHRVDITWPAGESIAGVVVDAQGIPIAGARLTAI